MSETKLEMKKSGSHYKQMIQRTDLLAKKFDKVDREVKDLKETLDIGFILGLKSDLEDLRTEINAVRELAKKKPAGRPKKKATTPAA